MKFDDIIKEQYSRLLEDPTQNGEAPQPNDPEAQSALPPSPENGEEIQQPEPLTPEGKTFLIDLARKALAFDPNRLPEFDREVLGTAVTPENAEQVLKDIQRIVGTN